MITGTVASATRGPAAPTLVRIRVGEYSIAVMASLLMVCGLYWDAWWHVSFGRHSFWIPPHLAIYSGVGVIASVVAFRLMSDRASGAAFPAGYRLLAVALTATLLAAPLDELWHRLFGVEPPASLLVLWSPPHLMALLSAVAGGLGLLSAMAQDGGAARFPWLMAVQAATTVGFATFILLPFDPTGLYRVGGVLGAGVIAFAGMTLRLQALALSRRPGALTVIALIVTALLLFFSTHLHRGPLAAVPHHPPRWAVALAQILPALAIDALARRGQVQGDGEGSSDPRRLARWGVIGAVVGAGVFYPAANLATRSGWGIAALLAIIAAAAAGGWAAGYAAASLARRSDLSRLR